MDKKIFIWDDETGALVLSGAATDENAKKKVKKKKSKIPRSEIYFPHKQLIFNFKETLNFAEQTRFQKLCERKGPPGVILLQDIKNLTLYLSGVPLSRELLNFLHLPAIDRFLRALLLYLQHYLATWTELAERRAASARRAPNPLAGGARLERSEELRALRCLLGREYADLLTACSEETRRYHHLRAGELAFALSAGERDLRLFETLLQFGHRLAWIALERKHKELIEVELHRLFRTDAFNTAKRKCLENGIECEVPENERWILYGPKLPSRRKILSNSPLIYEILNTNCDYRLLSIGLTNIKSEDPRIIYLENALFAKEEDLPRLGIKLGILGLPRSDFDSMLIHLVSEEDLIIVDDTPTAKDEEADNYETLMPASNLDNELSKPFPMIKLNPRHVSDDRIRKNSRRMWMTLMKKGERFRCEADKKH